MNAVLEIHKKMKCVSETTKSMLLELETNILIKIN